MHLKTPWFCRLVPKLKKSAAPHGNIRGIQYTRLKHVISRGLEQKHDNIYMHTVIEQKHDDIYMHTVKKSYTSPDDSSNFSCAKSR